MCFTIFSFIMAVLWINIFTKISSLFRERLLTFNYFSIYTLLILLTFSILRICIPLELPYTFVIDSRKILPPVQSFFCTYFIDCNYIKINLNTILAIIWGLGVIITIFKRVKNYYHFRHLLNFLPATEDNHIYDIFSMANSDNNLKNIKIIVHESVKSPAIVGLINPVIILPVIDFDDDELLGIFIHEISHYKYKHQLIKFIAELIYILFWWNPFQKKLCAEISNAIEMHSDKTVCSRLNHQQQMQYLQGIFKVIEKAANRPITQPYSCSLIEETDNNILIQRFKMILNGNYKGKKKLDFIMLPVILAVFLLSYAVVFQPYSEPNLEDYAGDIYIITGPNGNIERIIDESAEEEPNILEPDYLIKAKHGYDVYDAANNFICTADYIDETLRGLKIYNNKEEAKRK